jgi:hypothetical protein
MSKEQESLKIETLIQIIKNKGECERICTSRNPMEASRCPLLSTCAELKVMPGDQRAERKIVLEKAKDMLLGIENED